MLVWLRAPHRRRFLYTQRKQIWLSIVGYTSKTTWWVWKRPVVDYGVKSVVWCIWLLQRAHNALCVSDSKITPSLWLGHRSRPFFLHLALMKKYSQCQKFFLQYWLLCQLFKLLVSFFSLHLLHYFRCIFLLSFILCDCVKRCLELSQAGKRASASSSVNCERWWYS